MRNRAPLAVIAAAVITFAGAPAPKARREAERVFRAYIDARDRHDVEAILSLTSPNIRAFDAGGKPHPHDEKRLRDVLGWESVMRARWKGRVLGFADGWLEIEASEGNDLYDALGIGEGIQRDRLRIEQGRIVEWRGEGERSTGRDEDSAISDFKRWIESLPEEDRRGAIRGGSLVLDAGGARRHARLLERWRAEHSGRSAFHRPFSGPHRGDAGAGNPRLHPALTWGAPSRESPDAPASAPSTRLDLGCRPRTSRCRYF